jgi:hypothetical protein
MSLKMSEMLRAEEQAFCREREERMNKALSEMDRTELEAEVRVLRKSQDRAAELLLEQPTVTSANNWDKRRDQWLRDAGLEGK